MFKECRIETEVMIKTLVYCMKGRTMNNPMSRAIIFSPIAAVINTYLMGPKVGLITLAIGLMVGALCRAMNLTGKTTNENTDAQTNEYAIKDEVLRRYLDSTRDSSTPHYRAPQRRRHALPSEGNF